MRQELSGLRRVLGRESGILSADSTYVRLSRDALCDDIGSPGDGEFLEGLDLGSEPFDDWRRAEGARLANGAVETGGLGSEASAGHDIFENPSVLVMAFAPASPDDADVSFATGLVIDLRTSLSLWRWYPVIGPEAIGWRTEREGDLRQLAGSVGASYAISGTIRRAGDRIRVSVSLTDIDSSHLIWAETFEGEMADIFEMQEAIGRAVVARVTPEIGRAEAARVTRKRPSDIAAWQLVAQTDELERTGGEGYGSPESNKAQVALLEAALELEPDYARAWARLGRYYFRSAMQGWTEDRVGSFARAEQYCEKAVRIDPTEWEAQAYAALSLIFHSKDFGPGRFHAREAVRLNPSAPVARHALGCALEWLGEPEEALRHLNLVFDLNPNYPNRAAVLGDITTCQLFVGDFDDAVETAREIRDIAPDYTRGLQRVVATLGHAGETAEAGDVLAKVLTLQPGFDEAYVRETYPYTDPRHTEVLLEGLRRAGWKG